jgi:hypothetical protein
VAHIQFTNRPATVGSIVVQGDSESSSRHIEVHGADAFAVCPLRVT